VAFLRLLWRFTFKNRVRTLTTSLGVGVALLAFLLLRTLIASWYSIDESATKSDRMIIRHKISITFPLYTSQVEKLRGVPGVREVSWFCWFAGIYIDDKQRFGQQAVEAPSYFRIYPEYRFQPKQMQDFLEDPSGAAAGDQLPRKYGWKIGDQIPIKGTIYPGNWRFTLRAIYSGEAELNHHMLFTHWKYLNEKLPGGNHVQRFLVKVDDPAAARRIDALFSGSSTPTKTESELTVSKTWLSWSAAIVHAIDVVSGLILLIQALVLGNSLAMATRESTHEYAVMRAIGFRPRQIVLLVLGEGLLISALGVALGLLVAPTVLDLFSKLLEEQVGGSWELHMGWQITVLAIGVALATSMAASAFPAWRSGRLRVVDCLRGLE
jgi:putative ABC transport system permease protein